ncbi:uncharacterized protein METZ01_LOCUS225895 [marine metagenome]|uniref:Uncharacterized protein n=1 Tax=marine metagenome TaxID=408172 RepID=A0A382GFR4_9ZZZZ
MVEAFFKEFCASSVFLSSTARRTSFITCLVLERLVLFRSLRFSFCRLRLIADL